MNVPYPSHRSRNAVLGAACKKAPHSIHPPQEGDGDVRRALVVTMAESTPRRREVLALAALGGLAPAAIARVLNLPIDTVGAFLQDAVNEVVSRLVA